MVKYFRQRGHIWSPRRTRCFLESAGLSARPASPLRPAVNLYLQLSFYTPPALLPNPWRGSGGAGGSDMATIMLETAASGAIRVITPPLQAGRRQDDGKRRPRARLFQS